MRSLATTLQPVGPNPKLGKSVVITHQMGLKNHEFFDLEANRKKSDVILELKLGYIFTCAGGRFI